MPGAVNSPSADERPDGDIIDPPYSATTESYASEVGRSNDSKVAAGGFWRAPEADSTSAGRQ